jgi:hypothetical protein
MRCLTGQHILRLEFYLMAQLLGDFYLRKSLILAPLLGKEGLGEVYPRLATVRFVAALQDLTPLPPASPLAKGRVEFGTF